MFEHTHDHAQTIIGTLYYMSPELLANKPYSFKSDVWSLGCIVHELCTLLRPFGGSNILEIVSKTISFDPAPISMSYSSDLQNGILRMLDKDPENRPTISQLCSLLGIPQPSESELLVRNSEEPVTSIVNICLDQCSNSDVKKNSRHRKLSSHRITMKNILSKKLSSKVSEEDYLNSKSLLKSDAVDKIEIKDPTPRISLSKVARVPAPKSLLNLKHQQSDGRCGDPDMIQSPNETLKNDYKNARAKNFVISHKSKNKLPFVDRKTSINHMSDVSPNSNRPNAQMLHEIDLDFQMCSESKSNEKESRQSYPNQSFLTRAEVPNYFRRSQIRPVKSDSDSQYE